MVGQQTPETRLAYIERREAVGALLVKRRDVNSEELRRIIDEMDRGITTVRIAQAISARTPAIILISRDLTTIG